METLLTAASTAAASAGVSSSELNTITADTLAAVANAIAALNAIISTTDNVADIQKVSPI